MKDTARLIVTLKCNKKCTYCCNTPKIIKSATVINSAAELKYPQITITGGEPLLNSTNTISIIKDIKSNDYNSIIYLYTAVWSWRREKIIHWVDGIHYTLHGPLNRGELENFYILQDTIERYPEKSYRLYIDPLVNNDIMLYNPSLWTRIEKKPFIIDCPVPENEDLYILKSALDDSQTEETRL